MAIIQRDTQIANRYGLNIKICDYEDSSKIYQIIDFANISSLDLNGGVTYASGGAKREKQIGFYDKFIGEFTLSTQILTKDLLFLMTGGGGNWDGVSPIVFKNRLLEQPRSFTIIAETVWQDKNGNIYGERLILHKVRPRIAYNYSYGISGDVASVDIVFDILQDLSGKVLTRGEPKLLVVGGTLMTSYGYVTEYDVWVLENMGSINVDTLILNG